MRQVLSYHVQLMSQMVCEERKGSEKSSCSLNHINRGAGDVVLSRIETAQHLPTPTPMITTELLELYCMISLFTICGQAFISIDSHSLLLLSSHCDVLLLLLSTNITCQI